MFVRLRRNLACCLSALTLTAVILGCSGGGSKSSTSNNPTPTVTSLSPASATVGAAAQALTITGTGFVSTSTATYNGTAHTATYASSTSLTIPLTTADQATAGTDAVIVTNPAPGGGSSAAVNFAVNNPAPTLTSISPATAAAGAAAQTLTLTGTNFLAGSTVTLAGTGVTATLVSSTQLTIPLTAANQATAGTFPVVVTNPTPGGGSTAAINFTVTEPAPTVTSLSPASAPVGSAAQVLTVTGTNFQAATVTFNGVSVPPTITSPTQLTIPLTAMQLATVGNYPVVVTNPGGSSALVNFAVSGSVVAGTVYKGASSGSTLTAYEVNADGSDGTVIGTTTTDANGNFSVPLTALPTGAVRLTATAGSYPSEFDASTITGTSSVSALLDTVAANVSGVSITPASELVNSYTAGLLSAKTVTAEPAAHAEASGLIAGYLGLSKAAVIELLIPVFDKPDITANPDAFTLGLYVGALAAQGHTVAPSSPDDLIAALSADISDGIFDGKAAGTPVPLASAVESKLRIKRQSRSTGKAAAAASGTLSPTAGTTDLLLALGTYITSGSAITTAGVTSTDVSVLESGIFGGVSACSCTPSSVGLLATSSGATTSYSVAGRQYLIVAGRQQGVVVIDITDPTDKTPPINAWPSIASSTFAGSDVGGVIAVTGLTGHPQVIAFAYNSTTVSVLNLDTLITGNPAVDTTTGLPTDNPVDLTATLTLTATNPVEFSGGSAFIAGGIPDNGRGGVWLDTADGYGLLKLSSLTAGTTTVSLSTLLPVEDPNEIVAENMGGDIGNNQLLGGNYGGIQLVDLTKGKSYYAPTSTVNTILSGFSGDFIDGDSVDGSLRVGILTSEDRNSAGFLNLATVTETDASPTAAGTLNMLTPAAGGLVQVVLGTTGGYGGGGPVLSGSAVDKTSHLALFMAGYSTDMAVGQLQDPSTVAAGATWNGLSDWSYFNLNTSAELADYGYATDPHSVGVVINQTTGTPFGYLFDGSTDQGIVQIDLANFLALPRQGTTGDAAHQPAGDPGAITSSNGVVVLQEFTWTNPTTPISAVKKKTAEELPNQPMVTPIKK